MTRITLRRTLLLILLLEAVLFVSIKSGDWLTQRTQQSLIRQSMRRRPEVTFTTLKRLQFENQGSLKMWEEKVFRGKTQYKVIQENDTSFLNAISSATSSSLYFKMDQKVTPDLYLAWRWRAKHFPKKKDIHKLANRGEDDFAARIYVVFPGSNFFNTNVIEYIWDEQISAGTSASSPFSGRVKLFVIRTGPSGDENGGWVAEERNVYEDYRMLYGEAPERVIGAIALMSDSDNTQTSSESDFGDVVLKLKNPLKESAPHDIPVSV